ncbi:MAG TPA: hypothetical protein VMI54_19540 [Polyangiaceae bacterium]|nr:hypothetical protein [Polyangiaceae bacterium]
MDGTTLSRSARGLTYLASHPRHALLWTRDRLRPRTPLELGLPWISWPCIDWLERQALTGRRVFEYGGGGSTLYFLARGCRVSTVENSEPWAARIRDTVGATLGTEALARLTLTLVAMPEHPRAADRALANDYVNALGAGSEFDVILVDGADGELGLRMECLTRAREHLSPSGFVLLDDAWRTDYARSLEILRGFERTVFEGAGPARWGVTRTDVFERVYTQARLGVSKQESTDETDHGKS